MTPRAAYSRAIAALVAVNVLWGMSFPSMRMTNQLMERRLGLATEAGGLAQAGVGLQLAGACFYMAWRFTLASILLAILMPAWLKSLAWREWLMGAATGTAFAAGLLLQVVALNEIPASRCGFLTSLTVVFAPLLLIVVEHRWPRRMVVAGGAVALLGTAILTGVVTVRGLRLGLAEEAWRQLGIGDLLTIFGAFVFTIQILMIDVFSRRMDPARLTPGMFAAVVVVALTGFVSSAGWSPNGPSVAAWVKVASGPFLAVTFVTSLLCTIVAFHWMNTYQPYVSPAHAALIYTLEPIFATLWAIVLPDRISPWLGLDYRSETLTVELWLGGMMVVAGNILALWPTRDPTQFLASTEATAGPAP